MFVSSVFQFLLDMLVKMLLFRFYFCLRRILQIVVMTSLEEPLRPRFRLADWHLQVFVFVFVPIVAIFACCRIRCQMFCISMMRHARA